MAHASAKKQAVKEPRPRVSRSKKNKKEHLQNMISLRISDNQKMMLEILSETTSKSISDIMREAVNLCAKRCMNASGKLRRRERRTTLLNPAG